LARSKYGDMVGNNGVDVGGRLALMATGLNGRWRYQIRLSSVAAVSGVLMVTWLFAVA
jgi:hypothetical protein